MKEDGEAIIQNFVKEAVTVNEEVEEYANIIKKEAVCFHRDSIVIVKNNGQVENCKISNIAIGDMVLTYDKKSEKLLFEEVVYIHDHSKDEFVDNLKTNTLFYHFKIQGTDTTLDRNICLTGGHYVYSKKKGEEKYSTKCAE